MMGIEGGFGCIREQCKVFGMPNIQQRYEQGSCAECEGSNGNEMDSPDMEAPSPSPPKLE
jgi:hypothetical protein